MSWIARPSGSRDEERPLALLAATPRRHEVRRAPRPEHVGAARRRCGREPGSSALDELEAVRLVVAGEVRAPVVARALHEAELDAPARRGLVEVGDAQADVVDAAEAGSRRLPSATIRSASSSGIASATWSVFAETCSCSPGPARSTSHSSTVFSSRPRPSISTSTTSPGSIGRELAGVPVRITSPGSSVISRQRSASWYATPKSRSSAVASCTTSPLRNVRSVKSRGIELGRRDELRARAEGTRPGP